MDSYDCYFLRPFFDLTISLIDIASICPPYIHFRRQSTDYILYYILSGEMNLVEDHITYQLTAGDSLILDPSYEHYGIRPDTCKYFYVHFSTNACTHIKSAKSDTFLPMTLDVILIPKYFHLNADIDFTQELFHCRKVYHDKQIYQPFESAYLMQLALLHLSKNFLHSIQQKSLSLTSTTKNTIVLILDYLHTSFADTITSVTIEHKFGCNFDYINRKFKLYVGKTIFSYLMELRIQHACDYLLSGYYSLSEIAEMTGFCDVFYFSKVFKKYKGVPPSKF